MRDANPPLLTDTAAASCAESCRRPSCLSAPVRAPSAVVSICASTLFFFAIGFVQVEQHFFRGPRYVSFRETINAFQIGSSLLPLLLSLNLLSSLQITERLVSSAAANNEVELVRLAGRFNVWDLVGWSAPLILTVVVSSVQWLAVLPSIVFFYFPFVVGVAWAIITMRVSIVRYERLKLSEELATLKWWLAAIVTGQLVIVAYLFIFSVHTGILPNVAASVSFNDIQHSCDLASNASYLSTYCTPIPLTSAFKMAGDAIQPRYTCRDDGLFTVTFSAYDLCYVSLIGYMWDFSRASLEPLSFIPIVALVLGRLRKYQRRHGVCSILGDAAAFGLFVVFVLLTANFIFGDSPQLTLQLLQPGQVAVDFDLTAIYFLLAVGFAAIAGFAYSRAAILRGLMRLVGKADIERYACFLSHDWGTDEHGRSTHERVGEISKRLQAAGLRTWYDADEMRGDINIAMTDGIDRSQTVLVFVTRSYMNKAAGGGPRGLSDNVYAEFSYALNRHGPERMIAVVMEPGCRSTSEWQGVVGLRLGASLYIDCSMDVRDDAFDAAVRSIVQEVTTRGAGGPLDDPALTTRDGVDGITMNELQAASPPAV